MSITPANAAKAAVSAHECAAIRLLSDEYSQRELAQMFGVGQTTVHRHQSGECKGHSYGGE